MSQDKPLSVNQVAEAIAYVDSLDFEAKVKRADKIFADQPAVLGAVVQLHSLDVDYPTQEHALHVLLVLYECFTRHVPDLPRISEEMVQSAFDDNVAMLRFYDGETPEETARLQRLASLRHPEQNVLAFVVSYLAEHFPKYSSENELVVNACTAVMAAFVKAKHLASSGGSRASAGRSVSRSERTKQSGNRQRHKS
jgi:hypothetical protein